MAAKKQYFCLFLSKCLSLLDHIHKLQHIVCKGKFNMIRGDEDIETRSLKF